MTQRVGVELTEDRIRAVTVSQWSRKPEQTFEIRWDPRAPGEAVTLLRHQLGDASGIGLSIGLAYTHVKHVKLPPVAADERRGILTLEPDRFFAMDSSRIVVAAAEASDLVFAADSARVESWIEAFQSWAAVSVVEPAAFSLARALGAGGVRSGTFETPSAAGEKGIVEIVDRRVTTTRRVEETSAETKPSQTPAVRGLQPEFLPAYGAAIGFDSPLSETLFPDAELKCVRRERRMRTIRAAVNLILAFAFAVAAVDRSRSRVLERADQEIADLTAKAEGPAAMQARLVQLELQASTASTGSGHADPVRVLAAISRRLPHDAVVMSVRADGDEWQIDGTANHAASIVPALDADPSLENVRFLSASSRFNDGNRVHETFSAALHAIR
ncbi:MAG: PilN domain-containing protein [Gemmatimonadales bacterium]